SWSQVRRLRWLDVQSHSVSHPYLCGLGAEALRREVRDCKASIAHELGRASDHFAYPYGSYSAKVRQEVYLAGYASACAVHRGPADISGDIFTWHRIIVDGRDPVHVFARKVRTG